MATRKLDTLQFGEAQPGRAASPLASDDAYRHLEIILEHFPGGISLMDQRLRVVRYNNKLLKLLAFPEGLFPLGSPLENFLRFNALRGEYGCGDVEEQVAKRMTLARERKPHLFYRERPDGTIFEVRGTPTEEGGFVTTYIDVTERRKTEARMAHLAHHDVLTGLPNRASLREGLETALTSMRREGRALAVHMLDLDRFKQVNDTLGHAIGDALLRAVAERLRGCARENDMVGRLSGDEFAVVQSVVEPVTDSVALAIRIRNTLASPFDIDGHRVVIGASIGIALPVTDGVSPDQLMKEADLALYRAKNGGRGTYCLFKPNMERRVPTRRGHRKSSVA